MNFIPTGKTYAAIIKGRHRQQIEMPMSDKQVGQLIAELSSKAPWAYFGYDQKLANEWNRDFGKVVAAVDSRRPPGRVPGWFAKSSQDVRSAPKPSSRVSPEGKPRRKLSPSVLGAALMGTAALVLVLWSNLPWVRERGYWLTDARTHVLAAGQELALISGDTLKECTACPEMVVVPSGSFMMGSPIDEKSRDDDEGPQHKVMIAQAFAVSRFEVTFNEWSVCVAYGDCDVLAGQER